MLEEARKLLTVGSTCPSHEYPAVKYISISLETKIRKGNKDLEKKIIESGKNVRDCWKFVLNIARKEKRMFATNDEVMTWVLNYYDGGYKTEVKPDTAKPVSVDPEVVKKIELEHEKHVQRQRKIRDRADMAMNETGWRKDKAMMKMSTFFEKACEACEKQNIEAPTEEMFVNWVKQSLILRDCEKALEVLKLPANIVAANKSEIAGVSISEKDRKELIAHDMPTLF